MHFDPDELITISAANFGELISEKDLDKDVVTASELYMKFIGMVKRPCSVFMIVINLR